MCAYIGQLKENLARWVDVDDIKEAWMFHKNAITQTGGSVLDRTERLTHKDWLGTLIEFFPNAGSMDKIGENLSVDSVKEICIL
jgi:hypothetical protein